MSVFSRPLLPILLWLPVLAYAVLVIYGSLFPFSGWVWPAQPLLAFLWAPLPAFVTRTDITTNLLVYFPLGMLLALVLRRRHAMPMVVLRATVLAAGLSLCLEFGQNFLPWRNASNLDVLMNTAGAALGALAVAWLNHNTPAGRALRALRAHFFAPGWEIEVGLLLLGLWGLAQLSLRLPSLIAGNWKAVWVPFWQWDAALQQVAPLAMLVYALELAAVTFFVLLLLKPRYHTPASSVLVLLLLLLSKLAAAALLVHGSVLPRLLSLEVVAGALSGLALVLLLLRHREMKNLGITFMLLGGLVAAKLFYLVNLEDHPGIALFAWQDNHIRWVNMTGFAYWLADIWPFAAALYLLLWRGRLSRDKTAPAP